MSGALLSLTVAAALLVVGSALAQGTSVSALLKQKYEVVGVIPSQAGPGIFLKKGDDLMLCVVSETPSSAAVTTNYCKPVR